MSARSIVRSTNNRSRITINSVRPNGPSVPSARDRFAFRNSRFAFREGFTLLELLVVMAIIAILIVLVAPAFTNIKGGNDITTSAYTITGALEQARNYAMSNNTYVYLGLY